MPRRLPPLNSLRTFEVAARHLSFTRAAQELCVTQGAVSRQVKQLEDYLQIQLIKRKNRRLVLTEEGEAYMAALGQAFDVVDNATRRLRGRSDQLVLTVRLLPTLAMRWLIPRLHEFHKIHPNIQVRVTTSLRPADLSVEEFDVAIGRMPDRRPGLRCEPLMGEDIIAVCSPALLGGDHPIREFADIAHHNLLHAATRPDAWKTWLAAVGMEQAQQPGHHVRALLLCDPSRDQWAGCCCGAAAFGGRRSCLGAVGDALRRVGAHL